MNIVTVCHYIDLFLMSGVLFRGDLYKQQSCISEAVRNHLKAFLKFFLSFSTTIPSFFLYKPSIQTAAIVQASRKAANIMYVVLELFSRV